MFHTTNDAIYHAFFNEFYNWLLSLNKDNTAQYKNNVEVKALFDSWYAKYHGLERLCGLTQAKLANTKDNILANIEFKREEGLLQLTEFLQGNTQRILLLHGLAGVGKSVLVKKYFNRANPLDGECLFINIADIHLLTPDIRNFMWKQYLSMMSSLFTSMKI